MVDGLTSRFDFRNRTNDILPLRLFRGLTLTGLYTEMNALLLFNYENQTASNPSQEI